MTKQVTTLGAFSVSLAVKNLQASQAFYEKLGFEQVMGDPTQNWLILRNGTITIGLFQGMFDRNTFTFNPGWTAECEALEEFTDVRDIQKSLKAKGLALASEADESTTGPANLMLIDPDGNPVLIDQHVDSPPNSKNKTAGKT
jgi:catechol 2,3-dioxygenase-like lactoylglutathione lyase family enzyme